MVFRISVYGFSDQRVLIRISVYRFSDQPVLIVSDQRVWYRTEPEIPVVNRAASSDSAQ